MVDLPKVLGGGSRLQVTVLIDDQEGDEDDVPMTIHVLSWSEVHNQDDGAVPNTGTKESDLSYVLYMSGSTGEAKGAMISRRDIFTFIDWRYETFHMTKNDRVTSHTLLHFDLSTFYIYVTIKAGETVVLGSENLFIFPVRPRIDGQLLRQAGRTRFLSVASHLFCRRSLSEKVST
jgi:acyl-coenzyme A synthetase/AMP-(fatty) acid ligase